MASITRIIAGLGLAASLIAGSVGVTSAIKSMRADVRVLNTRAEQMYKQEVPPGESHLFVEDAPFESSRYTFTLPGASVPITLEAGDMGNGKVIYETTFDDVRGYGQWSNHVFPLPSSVTVGERTYNCLRHNGKVVRDLCIAVRQAGSAVRNYEIDQEGVRNQQLEETLQRSGLNRR